MQRIPSAHVAITASMFLSGCVTVAPGADQVRLTTNASDVAACKALGNIHLPASEQGLSVGRHNFATKPSASEATWRS
jgi:hypothetical protein